MRPAGRVHVSTRRRDDPGSLFPLTVTKTALPQRSRAAVDRRRLFEALEAATRKIL
jgi:hypothetical protein